MIKKIKGREILDSRGNPTVEVDVILDNGIIGRASVPSGASTGSFEAVEKRDNDYKRYMGKGVLSVIESIETEVFEALKSKNVFEQSEIDSLMIDLDGTENKSRIGANGLLAVSLACAKAAAESLNIPLFRYLGGVQAAGVIPTPMMNLINGGVHADNRLDIQEFMIIPQGRFSFAESIRMGSEIFHHLKSLLKNNGHNTNVGDEGGFAPNFSSSKQALDFLVQAIESAGYEAGSDVMIGLDVASNELYKDGKYHLNGEGLVLDADGMIQYYEDLINNYPIYSIEDGLSEEDWDGWAKLSEAINYGPLLIGDDLFVTNPDRFLKGVEQNIANAILIKPNQIGTLSETLNVIKLAQINGYAPVLSHRSGETEDTFIAHLAYACNIPLVKMGSASRTDRLCKYNEMIRIDEM